MVVRRDLMDHAIRYVQVRYVNTEQELARLKRDTDPDILGGISFLLSTY